MKAKQLTALILALGMTAAALTGCSGTQDGSSAAGTPSAASAASDEGETESTASETGEKQLTEASGAVKILTGVTGGKDDAEMDLFAKTLGEATGLEVTMEKPADYDQTLIQKLNAGEQYDLVYLGMTQYLSLVDQGALMDLTDFMNNSPIFSDPEQINPQELADITVDGKIYAGFNKKEVHRVVGLNRVHLENAGIEDYKSIEPTLDGYYNVFKALKESNTAENYYPLDIVLSEVYDIQPWMAAVGLKGGVVTDDDGKTYVPFSTDDSIPVWEWLAKLYSEDLLDPSCAVDKTTDLRDKLGAASQLTSCAVDWAAWIGLQNANAAAENISTDQYEIVSLPGVETPDGSYMLTKGGASLWGVPVNAANPDGAKKILEYFATQEGGELLSVGIRDNDYTVNSDGTYTLTEIGTAHGCDHGAPVPINEKFVNPIGYNLGVEEALSYGKYASIETPLSNEADYKEIVGKWGVQIVSGEVSAKDGLAQMREELIARGVCEK